MIASDKTSSGRMRPYFGGPRYLEPWEGRGLLAKIGVRIPALFHQSLALTLLSFDSDESKYVAYCKTSFFRNTISWNLPICMLSVDVVDFTVVSIW